MLVPSARRTPTPSTEETYHPYMWLWKPHYYSYEHNFYNFPYAFGHLFGLGLYAVYRAEGEKFVPRYVELLRAHRPGLRRAAGRPFRHRHHPARLLAAEPVCD